MSSGSSKPPKAPDPQMVIDAQTRANRYNEVTPYGASTWSTDANGNATRTQSLNTQGQAAYDRSNAIAARDPEMAQAYQLPPGFEALQSAIGGRVGERYGAAKPSAKPMQQPNVATMNQTNRG
jgi:hypothetical protein